MAPVRPVAAPDVDPRLVCPECEGKGYVRNRSLNPATGRSSRFHCRHCRGTGVRPHGWEVFWRRLEKTRIWLVAGLVLAVVVIILFLLSQADAIRLSF